MVRESARVDGTQWHPAYSSYGSTRYYAARPAYGYPPANRPAATYTYVPQAYRPTPAYAYPDALAPAYYPYGYGYGTVDGFRYLDNFSAGRGEPLAKPGMSPQR